MQIECNFFGPLRDTVGEKTVVREVDANATVGDLVAELVADHGLGGVFTDDGGLGSVTATLNGTNISHLDGLDTALEDGDVIRLAPPVVGGASSVQRASKQ